MNDRKTREEMRVPLYNSDAVTTVPAAVTPDMPLEALNLNWTERDLPERVRTRHVHRLHPYLGKFIPQLAEVFLRKYFLPGQTVFDPFAGSGTTLVQANELGINAIGCDISAFNVMLCRAKTARYDLHLVQAEINDALARLRAVNARRIDVLPLFGGLPEEMPEASSWLQTWYAAGALRELLAYRTLIDEQPYQYKDLLRVILSRSARSARLTTHFDLDFPKQPQQEAYWCYKHRRMCAPTTEALKFIVRYSSDTIRRVTEFASKRTDAWVEIRHQDSRAGIDHAIDGVITSPPYIGLIDYHHQHSYAYHLLNLVDRAAEEIGAAAGGSSARAKKQYQQDIAQVFAKALERMSSGGVMVVIAADRSDLYPEIARILDVDVEAIILRHVNRRTGRRSGEFYESVFVWRKR